jgi:FkbM family methyltransferase
MSRWFRAVHAFEPQRVIFQMLCGNLALNGRTNVVAYNLALYDRAGPMRLAPSEVQEEPITLRNDQPDYACIHNAGGLTFEFVSDGVGDVRAIALDDLGLADVGLIKVDAQGADFHVLSGAGATIRRSRPVVLFEWERDLGKLHGVVLDDYHTFFSNLDYDVRLLHETTAGRQADFIATPR